MKMETLSVTGTTPIWAGSIGNRETLLSGGAKLDPAAFTANGAGKKFVPSGTLVGKTLAETTFGPADVADTELAFVWLDVADAAVNNDVELYVAGEVRVDRLPAAPAANLLAVIRTQYALTNGGL